jgi:hypothetical protein
MTTNYPGDLRTHDATGHAGALLPQPPAQPRRLSTETKSAFKTTELLTYLAAVAGVLIASAVIGTNDNDSDFFRGDRAWLYVTLLTIGYMVSRGLAKSGSRERYDAAHR